MYENRLIANKRFFDIIITIFDSDKKSDFVYDKHRYTSYQASIPDMFCICQTVIR